MSPEEERRDRDEAVPEEPTEAAPDVAGEVGPDEPAEPPREDAAEGATEGPAEPPREDAADAAAAASEDPGEQPGAGEPAAERPAEGPRGRRRAEKAEPEVIPGEHLEPDLVLEEEEGEPATATADELAAPDQPAVADAVPPEPAPELEPPGETRPADRKPRDLAADARYRATGKRKSSVARVTLKPGSGAYTVNGRSLEDAFPRPTLQTVARQPLETAGYQARMDVVARIHGGGVSSQAGALRHGIARALVEADPSLRLELKRRGFLTRDARVKERKKAGLKKARKRPQFSKR